MSIAENIRRLRESHNLTQREFGAIAGVSDKAVSTWEVGTKEPRLGAVTKLAEYFGISKSAILDDKENLFPVTLERLCTAWDVTPERVEREVGISHARMLTLRRGQDVPTEDELDRFTAFFHVPHTALLGEAVEEVSNVQPIRRTSLRDGGSTEHRIPVLGRVPAGIPIEAVADVLYTVELDDHFAESGYEYFGLAVTGDSMYPEYLDGDVVILRVQSTAETGDDVVAYIGNDDATLKRIAVTDNGIQLRPLNPIYPTRAFSRQEILSLPITIAGVVVEQRRLRRRKG